MTNKMKSKILEAISNLAKTEEARLKKAETPEQAARRKKFTGKLGHSYLTRRQLIAAGLLPGLGYLVGPNIFKMLSPSDKALADLAPCPVPNPAFAPYISLTLAGGASLAANFVALGQNQNLISGMDLLGLGNDVTAWSPLLIGKSKTMMAQSNAKSLDAQVGSFYLGMRDQLAKVSVSSFPNILANTIITTGWLQNTNDTFMNTSSILGLILDQAGALSFGSLGQSAMYTNTGNYQYYVEGSPVPPNPLLVTGLSSIVNAAAKQIDNLSPAQSQTLLNTVSQLNAQQAGNLTLFQDGYKTSELFTCGVNANVNLLTKGTNSPVDPSQNAMLNTIWGLASEMSTSETFQDAIIAYNVCNRNATAGALLSPDWDYHGDPVDVQRGKDYEGGVLVARLLQTAAALNVPLCVDVNSDGSCGYLGTPVAGGGGDSDYGECSGRIMFFFSPTNSHSLVTPGQYQVSYINAAQTADTSQYAATASGGAHAAAANYFSFCLGVSAAQSIMQKYVPASNQAQVASSIRIQGNGA